MILGRVTAAVHATVQNPHLRGRRLLAVRPLDQDLRPSGPPVIGVDRVDAGPGDLVLLVKEGGSARLILDDSETPVQAVIVAVVDGVDLAESR
jgi:microcompartment protein CcmK/EutM